MHACRRMIGRVHHRADVRFENLVDRLSGSDSRQSNVAPERSAARTAFPVRYRLEIHGTLCERPESILEPDRKEKLGFATCGLAAIEPINASNCDTLPIDDRADSRRRASLRSASCQTELMNFDSLCASFYL